MKISVIGTGYVGLIQATGLASFGFEVMGIDIDETKVKMLNEGLCPLHEEGLEELLRSHVGKNLKFTTSYECLKESEVIFLCVGTPQDRDGNTDLRFLFSATDNLKNYVENSKYLVIKSTVPIGTNRMIKERLNNPNIEIISNPEFLREGIALKDFFNPERIVLGFEDFNPESRYILEIYGEFMKKNIPFVITNWETSEMIKYASNAFLATKISFINELSKLADLTNSNIKTVAYAMGMDDRIGGKFLNAGIGYGGSCFPKDVKSLIKQFENHDIVPNIIGATDRVNEDQIFWFFNKLKERYGGDIAGKTISVLGLSFKPKTDDLRESASIKLIDLLLKEGAIVKGFDYVKKARENAYNMYNLDKSRAFYGYNLYILDSVRDAVVNSDGIIIAVEYEELNFENWADISKSVNKKILFDGKNILNKDVIEEIGFEYVGVGIN
ncbi:UDP-glucose 6-dehydrogenase [Methanococcus maripaludis C5]|uniref:UDP-glucose 6-dehydrogenase n=1 Tax=Methanococcus maripaludis (strain C5 / ATCC BAA-1333) TaxID=402880 RepID=A4FX80_METM5|nr:UDP-glucose/GDP-mannose dehydrogenase family protein [Methanococcus maripaludis]ABO34809.1 UDP-glucose 6-dehydrogenase [Methanococcus maripaludis C5]